MSSSRSASAGASVRRARRAGFHRAIQLAAAAFLCASGAMPLDAQVHVAPRARDMELRGVIRPSTRDVKAELRAFVSTPFGSIPVTGYGALTYTCTGQFSGTIEYNPIIRALARLKGIELITRLDGRVAQDGNTECGRGPDMVLAGRAVIDSLSVSGWVRVAADSVAFRGIAWFDGKAHHGEVESVRRHNKVDVSYSMYGPRPAARKEAAGMVGVR